MFGPKDEDEEEFGEFVDNAGYSHRTQREMIEANLGLEEAWDTGAGCGQDADNVEESEDD